VLLPAATRYESAQFRGRVPKTLSDWIVKQAAFDYNLSEPTLRGWLDTGQLYLLIDDVSSLSTDEREEFVRELDDLHRMAGVNRIVIATRSEDLTSVPQRLPLHGVEVRIPDPQAVDFALAQLGPAGAGLQKAHKQNDDLRSVLRAPVYVAAAALGFRGRRTDQSLTGAKGQELLDLVLDRYVSSMTDSHDRRQDYEPTSTRYFASSIADLMARDRSSFVLALPDPRWIDDQKVRAVVALGPRIAAYLIVAVTCGVLGYLLGGTILALVQIGAGILLLQRTLFGNEAVDDPRKSLVRKNEGGERRFVKRRLLNSPLRLLLLAVIAVATAALLVASLQNLSSLRTLPFWPLWVVGSAAGMGLATYFLLTETAPPRRLEFDDFGAGQDTPNVRSAFAHIGIWPLLLAGVNGICSLFFGLFLNSALDLPLFRSALSSGLPSESPPIARFSHAVLAHVDQEFLNSPLGYMYLRPEWPWLWGAFGAAIGLITGLVGVAVIGISVSASGIVMCKEGRIPANYNLFLHHLVRLTFFIRSGGRYSFTHPLIQDFFRRQWDLHAANRPAPQPGKSPRNRRWLFLAAGLVITLVAATAVFLWPGLTERSGLEKALPISGEDRFAQPEIDAAGRVTEDPRHLVNEGGGLATALLAPDCAHGTELSPDWVEASMAVADYLLFDQPSSTYAEAEFLLIAVKGEHREQVKEYLTSLKDKCYWDPANPQLGGFNIYPHHRVGNASAAYDITSTTDTFSRILAYSSGYLLVGSAKPGSTQGDNYKQFLDEAFTYAAERVDRTLHSQFGQLR
jgi:hypothetical protein